MPSGARLAFRYKRQYILKAVLDKIDSNEQLADTVCLIVYTDQADKAAQVNFIPCRYARVIQVSEFGSKVGLELELGEFANAANLAAFSTALKTAASDQQPHRNLPAPEVIGSHWLLIDDNAVANVVTKQQSGDGLETV